MSLTKTPTGGKGIASFIRTRSSIYNNNATANSATSPYGRRTRKTNISPLPKSPSKAKTTPIRSTNTDTTTYKLGNGSRRILRSSSSGSSSSGSSSSGSTSSCSSSISGSSSNRGRRNTPYKTVNYEVVVVDDDSSDSSRNNRIGRNNHNAGGSIPYVIIDINSTNSNSISSSSGSRRSSSSSASSSSSSSSSSCSSSSGSGSSSSSCSSSSSSSGRSSGSSTSGSSSSSSRSTSSSVSSSGSSSSGSSNSSSCSSSSSVGSSHLSSSSSNSSNSSSNSSSCSRSSNSSSNCSSSSSSSNSSCNSSKRRLSKVSSSESSDNACVRNNDEQSENDLEEDPQEIAYKQFRLNNVPDQLPCREHEYHSLHSFLTASIASIQGGAPGQLQFISGVPGTGKTATALCCIKHVQEATESCNKIKVVKVNCLELAQPNSVFQVLYKQITGDMRSRSVQKCYEALNSYFEDDDSDKPITVMVVDEIDTIMTKKSHVYTLFDWPFRKHAKLILIAICNTINLPDKIPPRCRSRIGCSALTFTPYKKEDIETIIRKRLDFCGTLRNGLPVFTDKAIAYCALRVCNSTGDARLALKICSQALLYTSRGKQVTHAAIAAVSVEMGGATFIRNAVWAMTYYQKLFLFCGLEAARETERSGGESPSLLEIHARINGRISTDTQHACKIWSIEDTMAIADTLSSMNIIICEACVPRAVGHHSNVETKLGFSELATPRSPLKSGLSKKGGGEVVPTVDEAGGDVAIRMDPDLMMDLEETFQKDDEMHVLCENFNFPCDL